MNLADFIQNIEVTLYDETTIRKDNSVAIFKNRIF